MYSTFKLQKKIVALWSLFSISLNIAQPAFVALALAPVIVPPTTQAQDLPPTESPSPDPSVSPTDSPTPSAEPSPEPTLSPSPSPEPSIAPSPSADPATPTPSPSVEPSALASDAPTPAPSDTPSNPEPSQDSSPAPPVESPSPLASPVPSASAGASVNLDEELHIVVIENTQAASIEEFDLTVTETGSAQLATDKLDYAPTDTALITGNGFLPNTEYTIVISSTDSPATSTTVVVDTDELGTLFYAYQLDGNYRPNYQVLAQDSSGNTVATITFTDNRDISVLTVNGSSSTSVAPSTTVAVLLGISTDGSGEGNDWESTSYTIEGQSAVCDNTPNITADSGVTNISFNLTSPASSGVYDLTVIAYGNNGCTGQSDTSTLSNAITVTSPVTPGTIPFLETFGASNNAVVTNWNEIDPAEIISGSGEDAPTSGQFAKIGDNGWICKPINATGSTDLELSYFWKGDADAENDDSGIVEYKVSGNCSDGSGWTNIASHDLDDESWDQALHILPGSLDNTSFNLRFRTNASSSSEAFRVDNINITSNPPTPPVANPSLNATCGIDIGLVIDTSSSIDDDELSTMKSALNTFVSAFIGTPTQMSVVSFDDSAVVQSGFTSNLASLTSVINGINGSGYTNWEDAIHDTRVLFPNRADKPDLIVFTSDGNPTASSAGGNDTNQPNAHLAPAIAEANLAKTAGIRMITLGIGGDLSASNLQSISSADAYYSSANFATLTATLEDLVTDLCGSTISVTKLIDADGKLDTTNDRTAASGWTFNIGGQSGQVTDINGQTPAVTLTPASGYSVTETVQSGYSLLSASCTGATNNGASNGTNAVTGIQVGANDIASCTFINAPVQKIDICHATDSHTNPYNLEHPNRSGDVSGHDDHNGDIWYPGIADHSWGDIIPPFDYVGGSYPGQNWTTEGQAIYNNSCNLPQGKLTVTKLLSPSNDPGLFNLTINGTSYASGVGHNGTTGQVTVNPATYTVVETAGNNTVLSNYTAVYGGDCNAQGQVTVGIGETKSCTITNTRKTGSITFLKEVIGGSAQSSDWQFSILSGGTFQNGTFVFNTGTYSVTEVSQQIGYTLTAVDGTVCTAMNVQNGSATLNVTENGGTCKFTNTRDTGSVKVNKMVDANGDGDYSDSDEGLNGSASSIFNWSLDGVGSNTMGSILSSVPTTIPTVSHNVSENTVTGYHLVGWYKTGTQYSCSNPQGTTLPVPVDVTKGGTAEVTFCNRRDTGSIKIVKAVPGTNDQDFTFSGSNNLGNFTLDDNGSESTSNGGKRSYKDFAGLASGSYTFTETNIPVTWVLDSISCTGDTGYVVNGNSVTVNLDQGENVVCTFNNRQPKGTITIQKDAISNSDDNFRFDTNLPGGDFELEDDGHDNNGGTEESKTWNVPVGSYWVDERSSNGWKLTDLTCSGDANIVINKNTGKVEIDLDDGENVLCTYENTKLGKITGYKFHDQNADGDRDWFDHNLSGWTITLNDNQSTTTSNHWFSYGWYQFDDLLPGEYTVCEEQKEGWHNSKDLCETVTLSPGENEFVTFGNYQKGSITVIKDVVTYEGEPVEDQTETEFNFQIDELEESFDLEDGESYTIEDVDPGQYSIEEESNPLYDFAGCYIQGSHDYHHDWYGQNNRRWQPRDDSEFRINSGDDITLVCKNKQKTGDLEVTKYNDVNGNGQFDKDESVLGDWEITFGELTETTASESGKVTFNDLLTGWYTLGETMQDGWTQTGISCEEDEEEEEQETFELKTAEVDELPGNVYIDPGQTTYCTIGNQMDPKLTIEKSNDATGAQSPGSDVVYTIRVELQGSNLINVTVTDTPPTGFTYQSGSWIASSSVRGDLSGLGEPTYSSPGVWTLGDMVVGEIVTLTYLALVSNSQDNGTYKDIAWAIGENSFSGNPVDAQGQNSQYVDGVFVGTQVEIAKSEQQTGTVDIEKTGEVLGAATQLPATGATTGWLALALALLIGGLLILVGGKYMKKITLAVAMLVTTLTLASSAQAFTPNNLSVRMETPKSPTRLHDWTLAFSTLDRENAEITVKCYVKKPSEGSFAQFDTDKVVSGGGNGACQVNSSVLNAQGTYQFKVIASTEGETDESETASVLYDTDGPGTPTGYNKEHPSECRWIIRLHTADDGGLTQKVEIYSSMLTNFDTHDGTRVGTVSIGSNADGEFIHDRGGDCDKTWYYVIRAFDALGNQSGHIGDSVDHTVTVSPSASPTAALIVASGQGSILGKTDEASDSNETAEASPTPTTLDAEGLVAGATSAVKDMIQGKKGYWWIFDILAIVVIIYVLVKKSRQASK